MSLKWDVVCLPFKVTVYFDLLRQVKTLGIHFRPNHVHIYVIVRDVLCSSRVLCSLMQAYILLCGVRSDPVHICLSHYLWRNCNADNMVDIIACYCGIWKARSRAVSEGDAAAKERHHVIYDTLFHNSDYN